MSADIRVLIVEDDVHDAALSERELRRAGITGTFLRVATRETIIAAIHDFAPDVILTDHSLPNFSAQDALELAQRLVPRTPVIIVTGRLGDESAVRYIQAGAADYVVKDHLHRLGPAVLRALDVKRVRDEQANAEAALRSSQLQLAAILQAALDAHVTMDDAGLITSWNRQAEAMFGWAAAEVIGTPLVECIVPPSYRAAHVAGLRRFLAGGEGPILNRRIELTALRRDGGEFAIELAVTPVQLGNSRLFSAFVRDITARKNAERALRDRDEQFRQLADNIKEVFFVQDAAHERTIFINKAYETIWGRSCESLYQNPASFLEPIPEDDRAALFASIERNRRGEYAGDVEFRVHRPDGDVRWILAHAVPVVNERGEVYRIAGVCTDITDRKRAEHAMQDSERRARSLFEHSPLPMWVYDRDTLRLLAVNNAAIAEYGYTMEEFLAMTIADLRPAEDLPTLHAHLALAAQPGYRWAGTWRHRRKNGSLLTVELSAHDMQFENQPARLVAVHDVTARLRTERIQAALYRIADAAHTAVDLQDLLRSVHENVATLMPAKSFYIALYDERTDLITFPYFVDEKDPPPPPRHPQRGITDHVLRTGQPLLVKPDVRLEWEESVGTPSHYWLGVPLKAGERTIGVLAVQTYTPGVRYEEDDKEVLHFVSTQIATAIERKKAEHALRQNEERFRALVERSGDAIALVDRTGIITYASSSTARVLGREAESIVGTNAFGMLHPDDVPDVYRVLGVMGAQPGQSISVHARFRHGDGTWHEGEGTVTNRLDDPAVRAIVFNYRDVTERHQLETQLRQAQKMEAIGRLAGGIAHDFNNVLTAIFGYVDLLREELPDGSSAGKDLGEVRRAAERAAGLTRQLLAFSRQQVLDPVVLRINDLVEDVERMLQRLIGEDIELVLTLASDAGNVRADPGQLQQVVMNLVVNARDAMPHGGMLIIETANAELTEQYAELHQPVIPGPYVMLAISDTGVGMTPDVKARIFEPFFTTKDKGKGTGLGLSTVYGIVKQSGGYLWVYTEVGRGTTFKVYLPRVDAPAQRLGERRREASGYAGHETILLAEDDEILRPLARSLLEKLGYTVLESEDAETAVAVAAAHPGPIHLLVSDVIMPGASGRELARRLHETRPETKVLYVSGYTDDAIVRHGILEPGLNFLQKPFTPATLANKIREVLDAG